MFGTDRRGVRFIDIVVEGKVMPYDEIPSDEIVVQALVDLGGRATAAGPATVVRH